MPCLWPVFHLLTCCLLLLSPPTFTILSIWHKTCNIKHYIKNNKSANKIKYHTLSTCRKTQFGKLSISKCNNIQRHRTFVQNILMQVDRNLSCVSQFRHVLMQWQQCLEIFLLPPPPFSLFIAFPSICFCITKSGIWKFGAWSSTSVWRVLLINVSRDMNRSLFPRLNICSARDTKERPLPVGGSDYT